MSGFEVCAFCSASRYACKWCGSCAWMSARHQVMLLQVRRHGRSRLGSAGRNACFMSHQRLAPIRNAVVGNGTCDRLRARLCPPLRDTTLPSCAEAGAHDEGGDRGRADTGTRSQKANRGVVRGDHHRSGASGSPSPPNELGKNMSSGSNRGVVRPRRGDAGIRHTRNRRSARKYCAGTGFESVVGEVRSESRRAAVHPPAVDDVGTAQSWVGVALLIVSSARYFGKKVARLTMAEASSPTKWPALIRAKQAFLHGIDERACWPSTPPGKQRSSTTRPAVLLEVSTRIGQAGTRSCLPQWLAGVQVGGTRRRPWRCRHRIVDKKWFGATRGA